MVETKEWLVSWTCKLSNTDLKYSAIALWPLAFPTAFWEESKGMVCLQGRYPVFWNLRKRGPQCWHRFSMRRQARFGTWAWPRHVSKKTSSVSWSDTSYFNLMLFSVSKRGLFSIWSSLERMHFLLQRSRNYLQRYRRRIEVILH